MTDDVYVYVTLWQFFSFSQFFATIVFPPNLCDNCFCSYFFIHIRLPVDGVVCINFGQLLHLHSLSIACYCAVQTCVAIYQHFFVIACASIINPNVNFQLCNLFLGGLLWKSFRIRCSFHSDWSFSCGILFSNGNFPTKVLILWGYDIWAHVCVDVSFCEVMTSVHMYVLIIP